MVSWYSGSESFRISIFGITGSSLAFFDFGADFWIVSFVSVSATFLFTLVSFATKRLVVIAFWVWGWGWIEIVIWPFVWIGVDTGEMLCDDVGESDPAPESWYSFD